MSSLQLHGVFKYFVTGTAVVRAVDGVSLAVEPGELVAVYGPSGSGKTTLLLLAAGLLEPDWGRVMFGTTKVSGLSSRGGARFRRENVGFVYQTFHLIPGASAANNAALKLMSTGIGLREARRAVIPLLEQMGLGQRLQQPASQLSMGERQRVAIARALAGDPRLLLADEPTGNLDSARTRETLALLRDVCHERAIPGLLVTHDPEAREYVDRVLTLRDGHLSLGIDAELQESPA